MLAVAFIQWWYGPGWRNAADRLAARIQNIYLNFSLPILVRTLFAPWRRIITPPGTGLQQQMRAMVDNAISRAVGFIMRLAVLITALIMILLCVVFGTLWLILWPLVPILGPILIVVGLV
jgi:hypothetical protein